MKKHNPVVEDAKKLERLANQFDKNEAIINQQIYNSIKDEKNRVISFKQSKTLKGKLSDISFALQLVCLQNMHPNLELENVSSNTFFLSSNLTDRLPVKILEITNHKLSLLWYGPEGTKFFKSLTFRQVNKSTVKIDYFDYVKGFRTIYGIQELHFKRLYLSKQKIAFLIQLNEALISLTNNEKLKVKLIAKNERYHEKMANRY